MTKDLTVGKPDSVLWRFCLPLFGSILFQQLYNIADSMVAGRYIGENALAAVGNGYQITLIYIAFAFGCNIGCSVIVSQLFGAKRLGEMKTAVWTTWIAGAFLCAVLMACGYMSCEAVLERINTPVELFADTEKYLNIYVLGLPFLMYYNIANGIFSALGDSKTPFIFLMISSVMNIIVDIVFVRNCAMGVAGLAWATFLCQGMSAVAAVFVVLRRLAGICAHEKTKYFSWGIFRKISVIAIPSILQQSFISVGNIMIQGRINDFGPGVIAGYSTAVKLNNLVITSFTTLGNGLSNYAAQNLGAGKIDRIREGLKAGIKMVWTICVPIIVLYVIAGRYLVSLFIDEPTKTALDTGELFLKILSPFYVVISVKLIADGILRGTGLMRQFMIATFADLLLRVALAFVLSNWYGSTGIWSAWPIGWTIATGISFVFYFRHYAKKSEAMC